MLASSSAASGRINRLHEKAISIAEPATKALTAPELAQREEPHEKAQHRCWPARERPATDSQRIPSGRQRGIKTASETDLRRPTLALTQTRRQTAVAIIAPTSAMGGGGHCKR